MKYDFSKLKSKIEETENWLKGELGSLRTGRATPALVENIPVDSYGTKSMLKHVASINVEDARSIRITPWDASLLKNIEAGISVSGLGAQPVVDGQSVRISLPALTEESRNMIAKMIGEKLEKARVSLRMERDGVWKDIQEKEKEGEISEDEKFRFKDEMQKIIDDASENFEASARKKEEELKI